MKNLRRILFCAVLLLGFAAFKGFAQAPEWEWTKSVGGNHFDFVTGIATDKNQGVYITGYFRSSEIVFGSDTLINSVADNHEIFVLKYDFHGNEIWACSAKASSLDGASDITSDENGNIYITGSFGRDPITFDTITLNSTGNLNNVFVAKYNSEGQVVWAKSCDKGNGNGRSITSDREAIYLAGSFSDSLITFGDFTLKNSSPDSADLFIVKYDFDGNVLWAASAGAEYVNSIVTDKHGNLYVAGFFNSKSINFGNVIITGNGYKTMFVAKFNPDGSIYWARSSQGSNSSSANDVAVDDDGNVYLTGSYYSPSIIFENFTLINNSNTSDVFTVKFDQNGNVVWARAANGTDEDESNSVVVNSQGKVFITGKFKSALFTFEDTILINNYSGTSNIFLTQYDSTGNIVLASTIEGTANEEAKCITSTIDGNIYLGGIFNSPFIPFNNDTVFKISGLPDIFIAKLKIEPTSILEEVENDVISIFPNPTTSQFHITNLSHGNWTITIYTLDGQPVFKKDITEADATIDLSGKAKGAYVYRLLKDGEVFKSGKLVLQ